MGDEGDAQVVRTRRRPLVSAARVRRWAWAAGIDLREGLEAELSEETIDGYLAHCAEKGASVSFGADLCPRCDEPGYLDHIDLPRQTKKQFCRGCRLGWDSPLA